MIFAQPIGTQTGQTNEQEPKRKSSEEQSDDSDGWYQPNTADNAIVKESFIPEAPALAKLEMPFTEDEKILIGKFYKEIEGIVEQHHQDYTSKKCENSTVVALRRIECLIDRYLSKDIKLNSCCIGYEYTISNLVLKKMIDISCSIWRTTAAFRLQYEDASDEWDESQDAVLSIISKLLLAGGKIRSDFYSDAGIDPIMYGKDEAIFQKCKEIKNELKRIARESIINRNEETQGNNLEVEIDNDRLFIAYPKGSTVEVAKITNSKVSENLNIKDNVLQLGESIVRVESKKGKRNYIDVLKGDIEMSFTTEVGKISIYLCPGVQDSSKIAVKISDNDRKKLDQLKNKEEIGKSCLLGGITVNEAIEQRFFVRFGKLMRSETISPSKEVSKKTKAADVVNSSLDNPSVSFPVKENIQLGARTPC